MTSSKHISVIFTREGDTCAWIAFNERSETWSAETMVRVTGGVRYREREYGIHCPSVDRLRTDALSGGFFSQRPFDPKVSADPSMIDCALALFGNFCASCGVDASALLQDHSLNGCRGSEDLQRISEQAAWEGIDYPPIWNALWIDALERLLDAVCREDLADLIARAK